MINKFLKCAIFSSFLIRACFFLATFSLPLETCPNFALFIISNGGLRYEHMSGWFSRSVEWPDLLGF